MSGEYTPSTTADTRKQEATLYGGRFFVRQEVTVSWLAEIGDPADDPWIVCGDPVRGIILPEPTSVSPQYRSHIQVMPDQSLPIGQHYGTGHPVLIDEAPYKEQLSDGQYVNVRFMVDAVLQQD